MKEAEIKEFYQIRRWLVGFVVLLVLSGLTAFPIESELRWLSENLNWLPIGMQNWIDTIYEAVRSTNYRYPQLSYGTDWLAFAHIVLGVVFVGPIIDPVKNVWVIQFGMIACVMVFPLAIICGEIRHIPLYWRLIDCSFGLFGLIPLYVCLRKVRSLEYNLIIKRDEKK